MSDQTLIQNMKKELADELWGKQKKLEERIRELEEQLDQEVRLYARCRERVAKAREILKVIGLDSESSWARDKAKEALDVLEGK